MKILAIDLGKFKSTACVFEAATDEHAFTTIRTVVEEVHDLLALHQPDRVVIEIGSAAGWIKDLAEAMGLVAVHKAGQRRLYRLNPQELKPVHDWIQNFEQFWTGQLASIKEVAEQKAKQLAAHDRAASKHQPHSKERNHGH